jgi:hypothetical protein
MGGRRGGAFIRAFEPEKGYGLKDLYTILAIAEGISAVKFTRFLFAHT